MADPKTLGKPLGSDLRQGIITLPAIHRLKFFDCLLGAYNVSGEYAMIKAAALNGWFSEKQIIMELAHPQF